MADVDNFILRKIVYAIYGVVPYADLDVLGALHYVGIDLSFLPEVKTIELKQLSTFQKLLMIPLIIVPYFDLEWFKFFGVDPIRGGYTEDEGPSLNKAEFDRTAGAPQTSARNPRRPRRGGGGGEALKSAGSVLKYIALAAIPIALVVGALSLTGGSGYGSLVQGAVGNELAGVDFDSGFSMVSEGVQTLQCFGNAACMRAWRFNNTQRPGSEEVGQSYSLQVDEFSVNNGNDLDVAGRRASFNLPVGFSLYNPRHGLKGIPARGTQYRVRVEDLANQEKDAYCGTGWRTIGGEYASEIEGVESGTIVPGGFATPVSGMRELNLSSCGLLQPALGLTRRVALDVKYNYSSQATLYFEAMSRENLRSMGERPEFKQSETADTPVKSYVNVESPVTFRQEDGERASRVFRVRLGMTTDRHDISYRFDPEEFRLYDSEKTIDVDSAALNGSSATCDGLQRAEEEDAYKLSESMINFTQRKYDRGKWFSQGSGMTPVSCAMVIEEDELPTVSPSGETLTMRIDANYTVRVEKSNDGFKTLNGRCSSSDYNCPLLVPDYLTEENPDLVSECSTSKRVDAANGCDVRKGDRWHIIDIINKDSVDEEIEQGETAYLWSKQVSQLEKSAVKMSENPNSKCYDSSSGNKKGECWINRSDAGAFGITEEDHESLEEENAALVMDSDFSGEDVRVEELSAALCDSSGTVLEYKDIWIDNNDVDSALFFNPNVVECGVTTVTDELADFFLGLETPEDRYNEVKDGCEGVVVVDNGGFSCETTL